MEVDPLKAEVPEAWIGFERLNLPKFAALLASVSAAVGTLAHPLSVVTTNMQQSRLAGGNSSPLATTSRLIRNRGILSLYRGLSVSLVGHAPVEVLYFSVLEGSRAYFLQSPLMASVARWTDGEALTESQGRNSPAVAATASLLAGATAFACAESFHVPVDVLTRRMMVYSGPVDRSTAFSLAQELVRNDGFSGFYRGFLVSAMVYGTMNAIFWSLYSGARQQLAVERARQLDSRGMMGQFLKDWEPKNSAQQATEDAVVGFVAAAISSVVTHPLDTIKTRLQIEENPGGDTLEGKTKLGTQKVSARGVQRSWIATGISIYREAGLSAFMRGWMVRAASIASTSSLMMAGFEFCKRRSLLQSSESSVSGL
mmetsp:Transcript_9586/g.35136  ORF Transcript_9586/g.35136 Transcript_9586/m.35136 type:complete len:370 (-) Transcript_9586:438-1547(-)